MLELKNYLENNTYPGRFILAGCTRDNKAVLAYAIMGRSGNSRNRVFMLSDGVLETRAADESRLEDPSLIIYKAKLEPGRFTILTNGDHTETIEKAISNGKGLEEALVEREAEPDIPNFTPRIGVLYDNGGMKYTLFILKKEEGKDIRLAYTYPAIPGCAHAIHTYRENASPLPPFEGNPPMFEIPSEAESLRDLLWSSLDEDNKISLYVKVGDDEIIVNKYSKEA